MGRASGISVAALALATIGCAQTRPPNVIVSWTSPSLVVGRLDEGDPSTKPPVEHDVLRQELPPPIEPKTETARPREVLDPQPPTLRKATLPDDVVMQLQDSGRLAFARCFKKAYVADPSTASLKVVVSVELAADGAIASVNATATDPELAACLTRATKWLKFPALGDPVMVELPLLYRAN